MREWLKSLDEIDLDCVQQYEYLLGRELKDHAEYSEIDKQVDEMILEWENREEFFKAYPELEKYRAPSMKKESLENQIQSANARVTSQQDPSEERTRAPEERHI